MTDRLRVMTFMAVLLLAALAPAQTFTVLHSFAGYPTDGDAPVAAVIEDSTGNLYGTAYYGGSSAYGVVYEVSSSGTETVLYNFTGETDGAGPDAPLIRDSTGNLYGTTQYGGTDYCGVVFKVDTAGTETVLHSFTGGSSDGCNPQQGVIMDKNGDLYGTTSNGGAYGYGTVFKLTPKGKETILHSFEGGSSDGAYPLAGHLLMNKAGDLYGVASQGGASGNGVLYTLTAKGRLTVLHSFAGGSSDGCDPFGSVAMDKAGNLYGTTEECGSSDFGTVWKVSKTGKETILHNFGGGASDGCFTYAGVVLDSKGNLYGDTYACGRYDWGTVWELSAKGTLTLLHSFDGSGGESPEGELLRTTKGELFGTTGYGGTDDCTNGCGTVWSYVP